MTLREEAVAAYRAGLAADTGDQNPYHGKSLALAQLWRDGYEKMIEARSLNTGAIQMYLAARTDRPKSPNPPQSAN